MPATYRHRNRGHACLIPSSSPGSDGRGSVGISWIGCSTGFIHINCSHRDSHIPSFPTRNTNSHYLHLSTTKTSLFHRITYSVQRLDSDCPCTLAFATPVDLSRPPSLSITQLLPFPTNHETLHHLVGLSLTPHFPRGRVGLRHGRHGHQPRYYGAETQDGL